MTVTHFTITNDHHEISTIVDLARSGMPIRLSDDVREAILKNRAYLTSKISGNDTLFYGINTGFGSLCNVRISPEELTQLQRNLVLSHACGMGDQVPQDIAQLIFLLKIINLSKACSGVRIELVEHMVALYNAGVIPVIFTQGSLGASGDLAPLAHLSLMLIGEGNVYYKGQLLSVSKVYGDLGFTPIVLAEKEGIALLNGTQFSLAYAMSIIVQSKSLCDLATDIASLSMEGYLCDMQPYHELLHKIRPHQTQQYIAERIRKNRHGSAIAESEKTSVQDPYSFRCVPQVHGASLAAIRHATEVIETELNSVTDNPMVFNEEDQILSGGNFHAQPLALVLDYLAIALAELGSISERRTYLLINGDRGLPSFLTKHAGLHSGMMIAQYTAASIVSQNKQWATPASIDSIVSSKGQEDHVSMAANSATKLFKIVDNLTSIIGIEWLTASQALEFRRPLRSSLYLEVLHQDIREVIPILEEDRLLHLDMMAAKACVESKIREK